MLLDPPPRRPPRPRARRALAPPLTPALRLPRARAPQNVACNSVASPPWEHGYYARLLPALITSWRALFRVHFAALVVQLAPFGAADPLPAARTASAFPQMRFAQDAALGVPNSAVASIIDLGDDGRTIWTPPTCGFHGGIHPRNKTEVGRRVALQLAQLEGALPAGALAAGPLPTDFSAAPPGGLTVSFAASSVPGGFLQLAPTADCASVLRPPFNSTCCQASATAPGAEGTYPFELRLADGATWVLAAATVDSDGGFVTLDLAPLAPAAGAATGVRFGVQGFPTCALLNAAGLPMAPFQKEL